MNRGYIKLWRKSKDCGFLGNAEVWQLLCWCLMSASHKTHKLLVGKQLVEIEPGQLVFGRKAVALELNSTERKIRTSLKLLENAGFLTIRTTNKFSIISVVNWHTYQDDRPANDQQSSQQTTSKRPTNDHKQECKAQEEKYKESPIGDLSPAASPAEGPPPCPHEKILALYHEILPELPPARTWGEVRQRLLRSRHRETWERLRKQDKPHDPEALLGWWRKYFLRVKNSPFLVGREPDRHGKPFFADLEWLVRPSNYAKVLDGKYLPRRAA